MTPHDDLSRRLMHGLALVPLLLFTATCAPEPSSTGSEERGVLDLGALPGGDGFSRSPAFLERVGQLFLRWHAEGGMRERRWVPGAGLSETMLVEPAALPDELDRSVGPGSVRSSAAWRNGRLLDGEHAIGCAPSWAEDSEGRLVWAYDRAAGAGFELVVRDGEGRESVVAGGERSASQGSLAIDAGGRSWLAWESSPRPWGRGDPLQPGKELRLAWFDGEDWHATELPPDLLEGARGVGSLGFSLAEKPRLVADANGPLWLVWRAMARWKLPEAVAKDESQHEGTGANRRVVWELRAAALSERGWSPALSLPAGDGPAHDGLALAALEGGGVALCYETDERIASFPRALGWGTALGRRVRLHAVELYAEGGLPRFEGLGSAEAPLAALPAVSSHAALPALDPDPGLVPEGYRRFFGDLHRHSDLSRCKMDQDGSLLDQYRWSVAVGRLDFLGMSDHYQHLLPGHWSFAREMAERFHEPGRFATFFGFEQAHADGHRNLFTFDLEEAREAPYREVDARWPWKEFPAERWIAIPHQLADRQVVLEWPRQRPAVERVVELFQDRRGSYETRLGYRRSFGSERGHPHADDYLEDGRRFGFVASSDHLGTRGTVTAVYAERLDRVSIFAALRAGRTVACTVPMALDVQLGALVVGERGSVPPEASLRIRAAAGAPLARVEVVRSGSLVQSWHGEGAPRLTVRTSGAPGEHRLVMEAAGGRLGDLRAVACEGDDALEGEASRVSLVSRQIPLDEDGFTCDWSAAGSLAIALDGEELAQLDAAGLELGVPRLLGGEGARVEVRLDPPALGEDRFATEWNGEPWAPGDWVYVRLVRTDGEMAWSSPIFLE